MTYRASLHRLAGVLMLTILSVVTLRAGSTATKVFHLPGGDGAVTLKRFVDQSGEQVFYFVNAVRGVTTQPVDGEFTPMEALSRMLAGTPLRVLEDSGTGALTVRRLQRKSLVSPVESSTRPVIQAMPADELLHLSPFEVNVARDQGYGALQSNSLTAFSVDLNKAPATAQVFTSTLIDDVAATSVQEVLLNYSGMVGADPNNATAALNNLPGDRDGSGGGLGIRGLLSGPPKRDGMVGPHTTSRTPVGYNDTFSVERVELIEGPQSLLYGAVGGGGVVNVVSKRPVFNWERTAVSFRVDQYGSKRAVLDTNYGADRLAVRVAALGSETNTFRDKIGGTDFGLYAALGFRIGQNTTVRVSHELTDSRGNVSYTPSSGDLANFFYLKDATGAIVKNAAGIPVVNPNDPRRGQDVRYLALTGQLADLRGALSDVPLDNSHISSFGSWWSSEHIRNNYNNVTVETKLPWGLAARLTGLYSTTNDERATVSKNLVPAAGYTGSADNPFPETAVRITPGLNHQSDRTRGIRFNLLHTADFNFGRVRGRSQTSLVYEWDHQGPAFASSGVDMAYYEADAAWHVITNPAITTDYGRIPLGNLYFPVQNGVPNRPLFRPGTSRITINGVNYVLQSRIRQDSAFVSATNPSGLVPNNPTPANPNGFAGNWNLGPDTQSRLISLANYTEWWGGKLTTLLGASVNRFGTTNIGQTRITRLAPLNYWGYQYGANYAIRPWMRFYASISTAGESAGTTKDFYGNPLKVPNAVSPAPEIGLKLQSTDERYSLLLSYNLTTKVENETQNAGLDFFNAVNPDGLNGRYNNGDQWINLDRKSVSTELVLTARPTKDWRLRVSAVCLDGEVTRTVSYAQLYNDQFRTKDGTAVYADGSPVVVDTTTGLAVASGGTPLTLAMINDPASLFYAAPNADSGSITNPTLRVALGGSNLIAAAHGGASATGITGLPISAVQYDWPTSGNGTITVVKAGDKNTGINKYSFNFQSNYNFGSGPLAGFGFFIGLRAFAGNRAYYTQVFPTATTGSAVQATRFLYRLPNTAILDLNLNYKRQVWHRCEWTLQLNINNLLDNSDVTVLPSAGNAEQLRARLSALPRQFILTNTLRF